MRYLLLLLLLPTLAFGREKADKLYAQGNHKDALERYQKLLRSPQATAHDLSRAVACLQRINQLEQQDKLVEEAAEQHAKNWQILYAGARAYFDGQHHGYIIAGEFKRGHHRGGGQWANVTEQDRRRALQLMAQAWQLINEEKVEGSASEFADFAENFARMLMGHRGYHGAWRLQYATDLATPPDFLDSTAGHRSATRAPVDAKGNPVYYHNTGSFDICENDGQRWRHMLHVASKFDPSRKPKLDLQLAAFLRNQFGVQTARGSLRISGPGDAEDASDFDPATLSEKETIARLATGVKRWELPDEHNFVKIYRDVAALPLPRADSAIKDLSWKYYQGTWDKLPNFAKLTPKDKGKIKNGRIDVGISKRRDHFGLVFEGKLRTPQAGEYNFSLDGDDGVRLTIGDFVLEYDGLHGTGSPRKATVKLKKGDLPFKVEYFEKDGDEGLILGWSGPGFGQRMLTSGRHVTPQEQAQDALARLFSDRRQLAESAKVYAAAIEDFGSGNNAWRQKALDQIVNNWGRFEQTDSHPAGKKAELEYRFRNGDKVSFEAHAVKVQQLLDDVKAYIKTKPGRPDYQKMNIGNIGHTLIQENGAKYIGDKVTDWEQTLEPAEGHIDRRVSVPTPLEKAGAYLVTAKMADGNTSKVIVWLHDTVLVKQTIDNGTWYFAADAISGAPQPKIKLDFFGYRRHYKNRGYQYEIKEFAEFADGEGQLINRADREPTRYQWLITATEGDRFAYLGFTGTWHRARHDAAYKQIKSIGITDRPVYRPNQPVNYKVWVRHSQYDQEDTSQFAGKKYRLEIRNPKNEKLVEKMVTLDAYGGYDGVYTLADDATLGVYRVTLMRLNNKDLHPNLRCSFRVEEYKKPEFEVKVEAPEKPVQLGEKITAKVKADYYFGGAVSKATVKYKVMRTPHTTTWYPGGDWDWFYGPGYWWYAYDYDWYPGWRKWGCIRPYPFWYPRRNTPPEVVAEAEVPINADGTIDIEIDTSVAKELHGDTDHKYAITVEVRDESRRTIVGSGSVLVTREPFKVTAWVDRGHYQAGDTVVANFAARTPDGKPVTGKGELRLLALSYDADGKPSETTVEEWDLNPDEQGRARQQMVAAKAGQYRLSYKVTDESDHEIEGGYVFVVRGDGVKDADFRFNGMEITLDKREYAPGDTAKILLATEGEASTVVFFARPANGVYLKPKILRLGGKFTTEDLAITKKDMPNTFVEAFTIRDGKLHREVRELIVPPEKRVLDVKVTPSKSTYKPGESATMDVLVTDFFGEPFEGALALVAYDRSVDYISGGTNIPEIRAHFWKWRRRHNIRDEVSFRKRFGNLVPKGETGMGNIGAFGNLTEGDMDIVALNSAESLAGGGRGAVMRKSSARSLSLGDAMSMPASASPMMADAMVEKASGNMLRAQSDAGSGKFGGGQGGGGQAAPAPVVRTNFADTAFWAASLMTDKAGKATATFDMPENLTGWKVKAWGMGHGTKVGEGSVEVTTKKDLLLRQQAPRFFVEKDEVVLSANVHNDLDSAQIVTAVLGINNTLEAMDPLERKVTIKAHGEQRVDWRVKVVREGEAVITMKAIGQDDADAMEQRFPVYVHGMLKTEAISGVVRPDANSASFSIRVPEERRPEQSVLEIRYSPTLAGAMVDALPYLVDYPYGCTEQTLNRFLPTVLTQRTLQNMGLDLSAIRDKRTNLNAQEIGDDKARAKQWKKNKTRNPVFDEAEVNKMVKAGLNRLVSQQNGDGGWGWFGGSQSYAHTTVTVVRGLLVARDNDLAIPGKTLERGVAWLERHQKGEITKIQNHLNKKGKPRKAKADNLDAYAYAVLANAGKKNDTMGNFLYRDRQSLAVYSKAMLALAYHKQGQTARRDMIRRNIDQLVVKDDENQTAWLNLGAGQYWWYWYGSEYEAQAHYLKLLAAVDPKSEVAAGLVKYLLNNRKHATWWNSTRDTALCVEAMADYMKASGEDKPDMTLELFVDGTRMKSERITAANLFSFDNKLVLSGNAVTSGEHKIEVRRTGTGPVYFNSYLTNFSLEDHIERAGLEIKVNRKIYKLERREASTKVASSTGAVIDQRVEKYDRKELANSAAVTSGDLIEIELTVESKNDYEYIILEDMKAAGFEPVDVRSGYVYKSLHAYREFRDERVAFFLRRLARGKHSISYRLRAEIPGTFSALPTKAYAMYAPELKANSDEIKLKVVDQ
jgi:alpha-2-macroglobulin